MDMSDDALTVEAEIANDVATTLERHRNAPVEKYVMNSQKKIVVGTIKREATDFPAKTRARRALHRSKRRSSAERSGSAYRPLKKYAELDDTQMARKLAQNERYSTRSLYKQAKKFARLADRFAKEAEKVVAAAADAAAVLPLDQEFGKNTLVYSKYHDMGTSRLLARMDSLISAVRNSSLSDPFSHVLTPAFE
jgi:hypothetical protein